VVIVTAHLMGAGKMSQKTACAENQQMIKDAILEYQLVNHAFPSGDTLSQLNTLVNQQFLSQVPVEPSGGNYVITEPDANTVDVSCTVHGTLSNDD
jgi:hypothetical protein